MNYIFKKRTALLVLLVFFFITVLPGHSLGQAKASDLEEAKNLYRKGRYDRAIELFDRFIEKSRPTKSLYTNELCEALYYKAKMYFTSEDYEEMEKNLRDLYEIDLGYKFPQDEDNDPDFLKRASDIKKQWEQEKIEKDRKEKEEIERKRNEQEQKEKEKQEAEKNRIEQERHARPKKKFPVLLVVGVVVVIGVLAYFLTKKKPEKTLTVTIGEGVDGNPANGTYKHKQGTTTSYSYTLKNGYSSLSVKLDGADVGASGTITMDKDHTLTVTASKSYTLTVAKGTGVNGTPESGTFSYNNGDTVNYSYTLQNGYQDLAVKIDGLYAAAGGTITMNANHTLSVTAGKTHTLTVTKGIGVNGTPESGSHQYKEGVTVPYSYSLQNGYNNLVVTRDGIIAPQTGTIIMDKDHTLAASASKTTYTLTVTKGDGVDGTPSGGTFSYNAGGSANYSYSLQNGYKNLTVTIDGNAVPASGTITMNADHTLIASAEKINTFKLIVDKGPGVVGKPDTDTYTYYEGDKVNYDYKPGLGHISIDVILDGKHESALSGIITMDSDHTLQVKVLL